MVKAEKRGGEGLPFLKVEDVQEAIKKAGTAKFYVIAHADTNDPYHEVDDNFADKNPDGTKPKKPAIDGRLIMSKNGKEYKEFTWSPNNSSWNSIVDQCGDDTIRWDGKTIELVIAEYNMKDTVFTPAAVAWLKEQKARKDASKK